MIKIITDVLTEYAKLKDNEDAQSSLEKLKAQIASLQKQVYESSQEDLKQIEQDLTAIISPIFHGYEVALETKHDEVQDSTVGLFKTTPVLRMGPKDGHMSAMDKQGSGARRTMLWAALKWATERADNYSGLKQKEESDSPIRPHVLLMDEPEICLHPNAVRDACKVLYDLAADDNPWQVMVTTHSPLFIDVSRDNTTIVRVERDEHNQIAGTTVFRPARVGLSDDDRELLKMLNIWDPFIAEFFFGGRTVVVEGDTEFAVFRLLAELEPARYRNVHIVRARGKYLLHPLIKILNHFGSGYAVLHDADTEFLDGGKKNPAWAANEQIRDLVMQGPDPSRVRLVASKPNFEVAYLGAEASKEKPYAAVQAIISNVGLYAKAAELLDSLLDSAKSLPAGAIAWNDIAELQ